MRKLPIGIQEFEKLITDGFQYVDKTAYLYQLVHQNVPYFLSRPRRFGKSLLLSTIKAYWEGKKELFHGLQIESLEADNPEAWKKYPVFYFDFTGEDYHQPNSLVNRINEHLKMWEAAYHIQPDSGTLGERFRKLLAEAYRKTGLRCVVLVDEYDKPLLDLLDDPEKKEENRAVFKGFFSTLKGADQYLQFVFITGVTKFEKVSIFSDLNQLRDISMTDSYADLCGITEKEMEYCFSNEITETAEHLNLTTEACKAQLRKTYDGYHFHPSSEGVYNPFSLLNAFADREFKSYWFATGTPTFLVTKLKETEFDVRKFSDKTIYANETTLSDYRADNEDLIPLLYQTGYLTIAEYDSRRRRYTMGFPNEEVQYGMLESLLPAYTPAVSNGNGIDVFTLEDYIEQGNPDGIRSILTALFASIPYTTMETPFEHYFQTVVYLVFTLLGRFARCEIHTWQGRIDCVVEAKEYIYLFEFKRDESAVKALQQIEKMEYEKAFAADHRTLYKIGVGFDSEKRTLNDWKALKIDK